MSGQWSEKEAQVSPSEERPVPILIQASSVEPMPLKWLWPQRIPMGELTILAGDPGVGTSLLTCYIAAHVTNGLPWPDRNESIPKGTVIVVTPKNDWKRMTAPRLVAAGADRSCVTLIDSVSLSKKNYLEHIHKMIEELQDVRLIVVDPVIGHLISLCPPHKAERELRSLVRLARDYDIAILVTHYLNENTRKNALGRLYGSRAFDGVPRVIWGIRPDKENRDRRLLIPIKADISEMPSTMAFAIKSVSIPTAAGEIPCAVCDFESGTFDIRADDIL